MNGVYGLVVISTYLFEAIVADVMFSSMMKRKYNRVKHFMILIAGYGIISFGYSIQYMLLNFMMFLAVNALIINVLYEGSSKLKYFSAAILTAVMLITEVLGIIAVKLLFSDGMGLSYDDGLILALISKSMYFLIIKVFCITAVPYKRERDKKLFLIAIAVICVYALLMYTVIIVIHGTYLDDTEINILFVCAIGLMFSIMIMFYVVEHIILQQNTIHELEIQLIKTRHYEMTSEMYDKMCSMEHDINSHINVIAEYAEDLNNDKILKYVSGLRSKTSVVWSNRLTGIKPLDVVLSGKTINGEISDIKLVTDIQPIDLSFMDDDDICTIFTNILNNAVESCQKSTNKIIKLHLYEVNKAIFTAKMINSCEHEPLIRRGELVSEKSDRDNHGIGMRNVKQVLKKYGGYMTYSYDEEAREFETIVQIPIPRIKEREYTNGI